MKKIAGPSRARTSIRGRAVHASLAAYYSGGGVVAQRTGKAASGKPTEPGNAP